MLGRRKMLGLAVTKRSITAVEVIAANGGGRASRAAEFVFPDERGLQEPAPLGKALKGFLRANGFSASRCVLGMEADWLMAREKTLPPGAGNSVAQILSLTIEREFASDHKQLVFDYALGAESGGERSALLVGAPRRTIDQLTTMAQAAGLTVARITASMMALAGLVDGSAAEERLVLHLFGGGAELAIQSRGGLRMMRRLPVSVPAGSPDDGPSADGWLNDLTDELRRVVALLPGGEPRTESSRELLIWDEAGLDPAACSALSEQLALPVSLCQPPQALKLLDAGAPQRGGQFRAAAAMAFDALRGRPPAVDLLHSRLSPRRTLALGRKVVWAAAVVVALLIAGTVLALDWRSDSREAATLQARLKSMDPDLNEAKATIAKVTFARPWYNRRPSYLDCVREMTLAFPAEGRIWTTSLAIQEDMQVVFSGKAVGESAVLDVLDRLKANPRLTDVKQLYIRQAGRTGSEVAFAMSFAFTGSEGTWSSPSAKRSSSPRR